MRATSGSSFATARILVVDGTTGAKDERFTRRSGSKSVDQQEGKVPPAAETVLETENPLLFEESGFKTGGMDGTRTEFRPEAKSLNRRGLN